MRIIIEEIDLNKQKYVQKFLEKNMFISKISFFFIFLQAMFRNFDISCMAKMDKLLHLYIKLIFYLQNIYSNLKKII